MITKETRLTRTNMGIAYSNLRMMKLVNCCSLPDAHQRYLEGCPASLQIISSTARVLLPRPVLVAFCRWDVLLELGLILHFFRNPYDL